MLDHICFDILTALLSLNLNVNEEENEMTILLLISRVVVVIAVALYAYYFFKRKDNVAFQMWLIIVIGMLAGVAGQLLDVKLGNIGWGKAQYSVYFYIVLISYSLWKLFGEYNKRRQ